MLGDHLDKVKTVASAAARWESVLPAIRKWTADFHSGEPKAADFQIREGKDRSGGSNKCVLSQFSGY